MSRFDYIELFAGIGGFRSALDTLGGRCVFASEIDPFATISYHALYGEEYNGDKSTLPDTLGKFLNRKPVGKFAPELRGDITKIDANDIPDHDLLVGGFPCQAFSVAGQRKGFEDTRGTLFFEIARIAKVKQPRMMLLENVKGLLSHDKGRTIEVMAQALNDIGYALDFAVLNSKYFGVPQNRERIFIVAHRDMAHELWNIDGKDVVARVKKRIQALGVKTFNFDWPTNDTVAKRLRDVLESEVDEKYYLSDEKTAKLIAQIRERNDLTSPVIFGSLEHYGNDQMNRVYAVDGVAPTLTVVSGGGREQKIAEPQLQQYSDGSGVAYTVDASYAKGTSPGDVGKGRRTHVIEEYTAIQKVHSTCTTVKHDETGTLQAARLDEVPHVVISDDGLHRKARIRHDETAAPLRAVAGDRPGTWIAQFPRYRIRKLTPRECWRLQGFTDEQFDKVRAAGLSDSQLYKQAGNAVTVNVISATSRRLISMLLAESVHGNGQASEIQRVEAVV